MTKYNQYKINNKSVSIETYLLYNYQKDKDFVSKFNKDNWRYLDKQNITISDDDKHKINIILIPMETFEGITLISKMRQKTLETASYLNDIWTKDKLVLWYIGYDMKNYLLCYRNKKFTPITQIQDIEKNYKFTDNQTKKLDKYSKLFLYYLTNKSFHSKLKKDSSYIKDVN